MISTSVILYINSCDNFADTDTIFIHHCFVFSHCSGVSVFIVKAWIAFNSSSKHELTKRWRCNKALPLNFSETIMTLKLVSHLSAVMSSTVFEWTKTSVFYRQQVINTGVVRLSKKLKLDVIRWNRQIS